MAAIQVTSDLESLCTTSDIHKIYQMSVLVTGDVTMVFKVDGETQDIVVVCPGRNTIETNTAETLNVNIEMTMHGNKIPVQDHFDVNEAVHYTFRL